LALIAVAGVLVRFPGDYVTAQSSSAGSLVGRPDLSELHDAAVRDMAIYVPVYSAIGIGMTLLIVAGRRRRLLLISVLLMAAVVDLAETALFHDTTTQLLDGASAAELETQTTVTMLLSAVKYAALIAALAGLALTIARSTAASQQPD